MRKDYCDKCGKEINLQHYDRPTFELGSNGGNFQYNLEYSFDGDLSLHGVQQSGEFDKSFDLCITCALKLIKLIENANFFGEDN